MPTARIVSDVVREHAELAAFLWAQRDTLAQEDPPDPTVIAGIDKRLEANLDGLRIAGSAAWPFIIDQYEDYPEKGELFVAAVMAIEQGDHRRIEQVIQFARTSPNASGFVGALAWLSPGVTRRLVSDWLASEDRFRRWLGASALAEHRADPGTWLPRLLEDADARVRARAYQLAGICLRKDAIARVKASVDEADTTARYWAAWASVELGAGRDAADAFKVTALGDGPEARAALRAVVKAGPEQAVRQWLASLLDSPRTAAVAVRGAGMLGDRKVLPWLIQQMRNPELAVAAGAAFLELCPEAHGNDDLFSTDPADLGPDFLDHFGDAAPRLPVAAKVMEWSTIGNGLPVAKSR